ncbi:MAG: hypothetical protein EA397_08585 [Deltaproteobacteria bacterium]|nr:MAG: hypothetical protein EA397_08585 [Deltaproteobacteria bacterium]
MSIRALTFLLPLALCSCDNDTSFSGYLTHELFPFDGQVVGWTFGTRDESFDHQIVQTFDPSETVSVGSEQRHTLRASRRCKPSVESCDEGFAWAYTMSADAINGVQVHAYETPEDGLVELDPPLLIAPPRSFPTEIAESQAVDGHDFESEWVTINARCDQSFEVGWECAHFSITSDPPGHFLSGDWFAVRGYNVVSFQRGYDTARWRLDEIPLRP